MPKNKTKKNKFGGLPKTKATFNKYTYADQKEPYVTLWVNTHEYTIRERNPNDEWDAGDYGEILASFGVCIGTQHKNSYLGRDRSLNKEHIGFFPNTADTVFMIIESYGQGSTFGSTNPCYQPVKIFKTYEDAKEWLKTPEAEACKDSDYFGGHNNYLIEEVTVK